MSATGKIYESGTYQYWYDRSTKCWWMANFDDDGNQVGDAVDAYTRREILREISKARQAEHARKFPADPVRDAEIAQRAAEWKAGAPARAKAKLAAEVADASKGERIATAGRYIRLKSSPSNLDSGKVDNVILASEGAGHRHAISYVAKGAEARQECGGDKVPGPWASAFGIGSTLTANRVAREPEITVADGDVLSIDGIDFRVRIYRREYIALDRIEDDGSLTPAGWRF